MLGIFCVCRPGLQCCFDNINDMITGTHSHDVSIEAGHRGHHAIRTQRHHDEEIQKIFIALTQQQADEDGRTYSSNGEYLVELRRGQVHDLAVASNAIKQAGFV